MLIRSHTTNSTVHALCPVFSEIVRLSNELVYEGALQCGSEAVASGRLRYDKSKPKVLY